MSFVKETIAQGLHIYFSLDEIGEKERELVEWCVDFLLIDKDIPEPIACLHDFITDFLGIESEILLSFLDENEITEFGGSIICSWFNNCKVNPYYGRVVSSERREKIKNWLYSEKLNSFD